MIQRASEEEDEEGGIIASKAFNILVGSKAGLGRRGGEGVGVEGANKSIGPRRGVAGKVVGGELGKGVESEKREKSFQVGKERNKEAIGDGGGDRGGGVGGGGRGVGTCGGGVGGSGGGETVEVGGALVEDFEVAFVPEPRLKSRVGYA